MDFIRRWRDLRGKKPDDQDANGPPESGPFDPAWPDDPTDPDGLDAPRGGERTDDADPSEDTPPAQQFSDFSFEDADSEDRADLPAAEAEPGFQDFRADSSEETSEVDSAPGATPEEDRPTVSGPAWWQPGDAPEDSPEPEPELDAPELSTPELSPEEIAAAYAMELLSEGAEPSPELDSVPQEPAQAVPTTPAAPSFGAVQSLAGLRKQIRSRMDRLAGRRTVTLSVEKEALRVMVFKGREIVSWKTMPLGQLPAEPDPVAAEGEGESAPPVEANLVDRLHDLLLELGMGRNRFWDLLDKVGVRKGRLVMDLSLYTTLLRHLDLPRVRQKYLQPVVVSEVLDNIPFVKEEVDIAWRHQSTPEGESVFAIALPKDRVNSQVKLVKDAGGQPSAAYAKAVALAQVAGRPRAVVVHLEPHQAAIILVQDSVPQLVHQLEFPEGKFTVQQRTESLSLVIEQIAGYNEVLDLQSGNPALPVVLTGESSDSPLAALLPQALDREIVAIEPELGCPDELPRSEYATNLGLFLVDQACGPGQSSKDAKSRMPYLDLLPERHRPRTMPVLPAAVFITLLLLAIHPFNLTTRVDAKVQESETIARQLRQLRTQNQQRLVLLSNERDTQQKLGEVNEEVEVLEARLDEFQINLDLLLARLQALTKTARPATVDVFTVAPRGSGFAIQGVANDYSQVLAYSANLRATGLFVDSRVMRLDDGTEQKAMGPGEPSALEIAVLGLEGAGGSEMVTPGQGFVSFQIQASITDESFDEEEE